MCPRWQFNLIFLLCFVVGRSWMLSSAAVGQIVSRPHLWNIDYNPAKLLGIPINTVTTVNFVTNDLTSEEIQYGIASVRSDSDANDIIKPIHNSYILSKELLEHNNWSSAFNVTANFLGYATVHLELHNKSDNRLLKSSNLLNVTVIREERVVDKVFTYSVAILVSVIYINFGCALDWTILKRTLQRPVGPVIGFVSQFLAMPLISYGIGKALFPDSIPMQLGMFFTGVSPAGGASNIWTYTLGGNLNLSITMTTISTFAAFAMMPLWIFTLGHYIFAQGELTIPYSRIAGIAIGLVIPLSIGFLIQKYLPKLSKFMVRILKPFAACLIVFIVIFAIVTNIYLFKIFSWQILVGGLGLPWIGFLCGMLLARVFRQPACDVLAIAIETGVQNTGIAIFMLRFSLGQPEADLTTVIPVAVAIMTPIPLVVLFFINKWRMLREHKKSVDLTCSSIEDPSRREPLGLINSEDYVKY